MIDEQNIFDDKELKKFKENIRVSKKLLKEVIPELESLIGRIEDKEILSSAIEGVKELKLANASLYEQN